MQLIKMPLCGLKLFSLSLLIFSLSPSNANSNVLIEGFAEWQASRIEKIALDQAVFGVMENEYVKTFFPKTTESVESYGGGTSAQRLIPLIQTTIRYDIKQVEYTFRSCIKTHLDILKTDFKSGDTNRLLAALDKLKEFNSKITNINSEAARNSNISLPKIYNNFKTWICGETNETQKISLGELDKVDLIGVKMSLPLGLNKGIVNPLAIDALEKYPRYKKSVSSNDDYEKAIALINEMLSLINQYEEYRVSSDSDKNSVIAIHFFVRFFELFGSNEQNYTKFKSLGLFLASLIEASDAPAVAAVLDTFVDDQTAYRNKRLDSNTALYSWFTLPSYDATTESIKPQNYTGYCLVIGCQNTLFLGSYFGVSVVRLPDENNLEEKVRIRAFGPVGLEYKIMSIYGSPVTLNFAPIDIGNYVSNELQDIEYTARFSDIIAPSIFLSYSMKDRPFSFLFGYQKDVKVGNLVEENTFFVSFAFDLPIFTIY